MDWLARGVLIFGVCAYPDCSYPIRSIKWFGIGSRLSRDVLILFVLILTVLIVCFGVANRLDSILIENEQFDTRKKVSSVNK